MLILEAAFGCHPAELSALHVLVWVAGFGHHAWGMDEPPAEKLAQGTASLVDALAQDADAEIGLQSPVARIVQDADGVTVTARDGATHRASAAVLATPVNTWNDVSIIPPLVGASQAIAREGHAGHAVKLWVLVTGVPDRLVGAGLGGGLDRRSEEFVLPEGRVLVGLGHAPEQLDLANRPQVERAIRMYAPPAEAIAWDGHDWNADEWAKGTWVAYRPGHLTRLHSVFQQPQGRLFVCGSDIARGWAGFMDGAIETGRRAARQAMRSG